eukprot:1019875-Prorocentrum_minimum.AAC.4
MAGTEEPSLQEQIAELKNEVLNTRCVAKRVPGFTDSHPLCLPRCVRMSLKEASISYPHPLTPAPQRSALAQGESASVKGFACFQNLRGIG